MKFISRAKFFEDISEMRPSFEHTEAAELQKRESPTQVCPFAKQANNKKKVPCYN